MGKYDMDEVGKRSKFFLKVIRASLFIVALIVGVVIIGVIISMSIGS